VREFANVTLFDIFFHDFVSKNSSKSKRNIGELNIFFIFLQQHSLLLQLEKKIIYFL